jgi:hypothetical protein
MDPNSAPAHLWISYSYEGKGMYGEAGTEFIKHLNLIGMKLEAAEFERIYRTQGYHAAVRFEARQLIQQGANGTFPVRSAWAVACSYAVLGEADKAFKVLQLLYDERNYGLLQIRYDPDMDSLRSDPRYADLVRRIGFP